MTGGGERAGRDRRGEAGNGAQQWSEGVRANERMRMRQYDRIVIAVCLVRQSGQSALLLGSVRFLRTIARSFC